MTKTEKIIGVGAVLWVILALGSCGYALSVFDTEFGDCAGLEGISDKIWTGDDCPAEED